MREILFRGKRKDNGEWVKGSFWDEIPGELGGIAQYGSCVFHHVDLTTVGQFTGLTDKNGKKIFEGDILKFHKFRGEPDWVGYVKYDISMFIICGKQPLHNRRFEVELCGIDRSQCEVVGNQFDNSELLRM